MRNDFCSGYLMHHGIQGQKWGVRNGPPYPLEFKAKSSSEKKQNQKSPKIILSDNQKKILKGIATAAGAVGVGVGAYYVLRHTSAFQIAKLIPKMGSSGPKIEQAAKGIIEKNLRDTDIVLSKGTEIFKTNVNKDFDIRKESKLYASYDKLDRIAYRYGLFNWNKDAKERYEAVLKATDNLRGPSQETAEEIFDELFNNNKEYREGLADAVAKRFAYAMETRSNKAIKKTSEEIYQEAYKRALKELNSNTFKTAMSNMVYNSDNTKILVDEFIKNGYDFVEDYADKGLMARYPIVLLKNDKLTQQGVNYVQKYYDNAANREIAKKVLRRARHPGGYGWS